MSIEIMTLVWRRSPEKGAALLIQLALADWADDNGWCYPSINTLSFKARTSRRGAQKILDGLIARGMVEKVRGNSRRSSRYRVRTENLTEIRKREAIEKPQNLDDLGGEPRSPQGANPVHQGGEPRSPQGANPVHQGGEPRSPQGANRVHHGGERGSPNPSVNPSLDPSVKTQEGGDAPALRASGSENGTANGGGGFDLNAPYVPPVPETLPEEESAEGAWAQLMDFWTGVYDGRTPAVTLPLSTVQVWKQIGGPGRFREWVNRPVDAGFAMKDFLKLWERWNSTKRPDRIMMR